MSGTLDYSISLQKQATWIKYKEEPSNAYLNSVGYEIDSTEYEEYSYTGKQNDIEAQRSRELAKADKNTQVQTTMTRLNGHLWELKIRKNKCKLKEQTEANNEQQSSSESQYGSLLTPRQTSINTTAIQESILNHEKCKDLSNDKLGALKMYINGSLPGEKVQTTRGIQILNDILPYDDDIVQFAIKNPTYYVPSMSVTYQYWSQGKVTDMGEIGSIQKPPGVSIPQGYTSLFMGRSSSPASNGYGHIIQESYTIGKFNKEPYEKTK